MGTRGFVGFVVDGTEKIAYNHFDSYPSGLGTAVLGWLRKAHLGADSLFAEWGYLVDFDNKAFEAYRGFQHGSHSRGRFASRKGGDRSPGYYPCALEHSWPLSALPADDEFVKALEGDDE